jgi:hypothetical protein
MAAANDNITITVRNLALESREFTISQNATIMDLQRAITDSGFVTTFPENLRLFKGSTRNNMSVDIFDPNMTIADCNIINGDEIHAIMHDVNYYPPAPPLLALSQEYTYNPAFNGTFNEYLRRDRRHGGKRSRRNRNRKSRNRKSRNRKTRNHKRR